MRCRETNTVRFLGFSWQARTLLLYYILQVWTICKNYYKTCFIITSSAVSWQIIRKSHSSCRFCKTPTLHDLFRGASLRKKNLFELTSLRWSERCVFCLNLLRQLSKLADQMKPKAGSSSVQMLKGEVFLLLSFCCCVLSSLTTAKTAVVALCCCNKGIIFTASGYTITSFFLCNMHINPTMLQPCCWPTDGAVAGWKSVNFTKDFKMFS